MEVLKTLNKINKQEFEQELNLVKTGRWYHWKRIYILQDKGTIYVISLNVFDRFRKMMEEFCCYGNYFQSHLNLNVKLVTQIEDVSEGFFKPNTGPAEVQNQTTIEPSKQTSDPKVVTNNSNMTAT